jgi:hypothetical protein
MAVLRWVQIPLYDYGVHSHDISTEKLAGFEKVGTQDFYQKPI